MKGRIVERMSQALKEYDDLKKAVKLEISKNKEMNSEVFDDKPFIIELRCSLTKKVSELWRFFQRMKKK